MTRGPAQNQVWAAWVVPVQERGAGRPTTPLASARRRLGQPMQLAAILVGLFCVMLAFQGPITRLIGTSAGPAHAAPQGLASITTETSPIASSATGANGDRSSPGGTVQEAAKPPVRHFAVDPFAPRISSVGRLLPITRRAPLAAARGRQRAGGPPRSKSVEHPRVRPDGHRRSPSGLAGHGRPPSGHRGEARATAGCAGTTYTVVSGDTLWSIAERVLRTGDSSAIATGWQRLYAANRGVIGPDPGLIHPGQELCLANVAHAGSHLGGAPAARM